MHFWLKYKFCEKKIVSFCWHHLIQNKLLNLLQGNNGPNKRVSFHSDRRGGAIRKRGGIRGRLGGPPGPPMGVIIERDDDYLGGHNDRGQSGRARPIP